MQTPKIQTLVTDGTPDGTRELAPEEMNGWADLAHEVNGEVFLRDGWDTSQWWSLEPASDAWNGTSPAALEAADDRFEYSEFDPETRESDVLKFDGVVVPLFAENVQQTSHGEYVLLPNADLSQQLQVRRQGGTTEPVFTNEQLASLGITSIFQARDLFTGTTQSRLFAADDLLYFVAGTEQFGRELWKSDGTLEGTSMVRDILPGPRSSGIELLGASGDTLFFMANDGVHGQELWSASVDEAMAAPLTGDINGDDQVNFADFLLLSQAFGTTAEGGQSIPSDLNQNGTVDFADFLLLSANYGKSSQ